MKEITVICGEDATVEAQNAGFWSKSNQNLMIISDNGNRAVVRGVFVGACVVACGDEQFLVTIAEANNAVAVSEVAKNEAAKIEQVRYEEGLVLFRPDEELGVFVEDVAIVESDITDEEQEVFKEKVDAEIADFNSTTGLSEPTAPIIEVEPKDSADESSVEENQNTAADTETKEAETVLESVKAAVKKTVAKVKRTTKTSSAKKTRTK